MSLLEQDKSPLTAERLLADYRRVRGQTERLTAPLSPEDATVQSMPDASPAKWHMAHTTWFFETFVLRAAGEAPFNPAYESLFNSYYNTVGVPFPRPKRGMISRPSLSDVRDYRRHVDVRVERRLASGELPDDALRVIELGLHHEQQHQELILTDLLHALSQNPTDPVYHDGVFACAETPACEWVDRPGGVVEVGHSGEGFAFDCEGPRHETLLRPHRLASRPVTCGEYLEFIADGGYQTPQLWLSAGWTTVQEEGWRAPLYWRDEGGGEWSRFTLAGRQTVDPASPVCHVSYFEADAFARWAGHRLPLEAEWESAWAPLPVEGDFAERLLDEGAAFCPRPTTGTGPIYQAFGTVWEWTASPFTPYPGYRPPDGALGEYNGKFMCNQFVLRGGSVATPLGHVRATYRNFFSPASRWQFTGIRLASDAA